MSNLKKKVLIMGGGVNQIPLIEAAKELEYYVVLCDANSHIPGKKLVDAFYQIDISDSNKIIEVAKKEDIDGAVCNTESIMEVLATVQSKMQLIGNNKSAIENICDKYKFRMMQKKAGSFSPCIQRFENVDDASNYINSSIFKVIVKPEKSSGSRGVYVIDNNICDSNFLEDCFKYSRNGKILVEEYIDFSNKDALEAEVFLNNGKVQFMCLYRTLRDKQRHILPQTYCSDNKLSKEKENAILNELQSVFTECGIKWGQYNVEMSFNSSGQLFIIEINARQGGMRLPEFVSLYSGIDMNKLLVSTSTGDCNYLNHLKKTEIVVNKNIIHYRIITDKSGLLSNIRVNDEIKKYIVSEYRYFQDGDTIHTSINGYTSLGLIDFKFPNSQLRKEYEDTISDFVSVEIS